MTEPTVVKRTYEIETERERLEACTTLLELGVGAVLVDGTPLRLEVTGDVGKIERVIGVLAQSAKVVS